MKFYSETPSDFIIINAENNSYDDLCQFAIVPMSTQHRQRIAEHLFMLSRLKQLDSLEYLSLHYDVQGFYFDFGEESEFLNDDKPFEWADFESFFNDVLANSFKMLDPEKPFKFLNFTPENIQTATGYFSRPTQVLLPARLHITPDGKGRWIANGANTQDQFFTASIDLKKLLYAYEPELRNRIQIDFYNELNNTLEAAKKYFILQKGDSLSEVLIQYMIAEANNEEHPDYLRKSNIESAQFVFNNLQCYDFSEPNFFTK